MANNVNISWIRLSVPVTASLTFSKTGGASVVFAGGGEKIAKIGKTGGGIVTSVVLNDNFLREFSNGWGTADENFPWVVLTGTSTDFNVDGFSGLVTSPTHDSDWIGLGNLSILNSDVTGKVSLSAIPVGANVAVGPVLRYVDINNHYRFKLLFGTTSVVYISIDRLIAGNFVTVVSPTVVINPYTAGDVLQFHALISANKLYMSIWLDGSSEPVWQINGVSDYGVASSGTIAIRNDLTSLTNNPTVSVDDFVITGFQTGALKTVSFTKTGGATTAFSGGGFKSAQISKFSGSISQLKGQGPKSVQIVRQNGGSSSLTTGAARIIRYVKTGGSISITFGAGATNTNQVIITWVQLTVPASQSLFIKTGGGKSSSIAGIKHLFIGGGRSTGVAGASKLITIFRTGGGVTTVASGGTAPSAVRTFGGRSLAIGGGTKAYTHFGPWSDSEQITVTTAIGAGAIAPFFAGGGHTVLIQKTGGGTSQAKAGFMRIGGGKSSLIGGGSRVILYLLSGGATSELSGGIRSIPHGVGGFVTGIGGGSRTTIHIKSGGAFSSFTGGFSRISVSSKTGGAKTGLFVSGTVLTLAVHTGGAIIQLTASANRNTIYSPSGGAITGIVAGGSRFTGVFFVVTGGSFAGGVAGASRLSLVSKTFGASSIGLSGASRSVKHSKTIGGISSTLVGASRLTLFPRTGGSHFNAFASAARTILNIKASGGVANTFTGGEKQFTQYLIVVGGGISEFIVGGVKLITTVYGGSTATLTAGGHVSTAISLDLTIPHSHVIMRTQLKKPKLMRTKMNI